MEHTLIAQIRTWTRASWNPVLSLLAASFPSLWRMRLDVLVLLLAANIGVAIIGDTFVTRNYSDKPKAAQSTERQLGAEERQTPAEPAADARPPLGGDIEKLLGSMSERDEAYSVLMPLLVFVAFASGSWWLFILARPVRLTEVLPYRRNPRFFILVLGTLAMFAGPFYLAVPAGTAIVQSFRELGPMVGMLSSVAKMMTLGFVVYGVIFGVASAIFVKTVLVLSVNDAFTSFVLMLGWFTLMAVASEFFGFLGQQSGLNLGWLTTLMALLLLMPALKVLLLGRNSRVATLSLSCFLWVAPPLVIPYALEWGRRLFLPELILDHMTIIDAVAIVAFSGAIWVLAMELAFEILVRITARPIT